MELKLFEVGGKVRDEILGLSSKDVDYTVVLPQNMLHLHPEVGFDFMSTQLQEEGFKIFLSTPDCFTIRAKFPEGSEHEGLVADFVMARKEVGYIPSTRQPILELGTLEDDLLRRDFTVNAIARDLEGNLIDPFNGVEAIKNKILDTPQDPMKTLKEDPLRILRALRFSITKDFTIKDRVWVAMGQPGILKALSETVSQERMREEITKMMKFNTVATMNLLVDVDRDLIPNLLDLVFQNGMWLKPTTEKL